MQRHRVGTAPGTADPTVGTDVHAAPEKQDESNDQLLKRAKNAAYRYLTIRPRSRFEVEQKLQGRGFSPDRISSVIEHLLHLGYLNDEQFARQWAVSRMRSRGFGRRRIEQELRTRGVAADIVREALAELFAEAPEEETARREAEKKLRTLVRFEPEVRKRRLAGFLERKGFSSETIREILQSVR